jgi:hypothetical protein
VAIPVGFAEERAMLAFEVDPGDVKPEFFGVTAERDGYRIAHRDPGRQADVVIGATGAGHDPTAAFGEHPRAPWYDCVDVIGLRGGSRTERACGDQDARNADTKRHEPRQRCDRLECDPAIAAFKHRIRRTARKRGQAQNSSTPRTPATTHITTEQHAFYEFADIGEVRSATGAEKIVPLVADFDRV